MPYHENERATQEKFVEFTTTCREAWVTSYEKHMEGRVPPAYQDKPLTYLGVEFAKRNVYNDTALAPEHLDITPLSLEDPAQMPHRAVMDSMPDDIHKYYRGIANSIGAVALTNNTRFREAVPPNGVVASYIGSFSNEATRIVDSFRALPDHRSLKFAIAMARRALDYMRSDESELSVGEKLVRAIQYPSNGILQHRFTIKMSPNLPLNGYEGRRFLTQYRDRMASRLEQRRNDLAHITIVGASESQIQTMSDDVSKYSRAFKRAQNFLKEG